MKRKKDRKRPLHLKSKAAFAWTWVVLYAAMIFSISSLPGSSPILQTVEKYVWDKLLHLLEYSVLGILLVRALALSFKYRSLEHLAFMAFVFGSLYAVSDEWHQSFIPLRSASVYDWMADSMGILIGACAWGSLMLKSLKKTSDA